MTITNRQSILFCRRAALPAAECQFLPWRTPKRPSWPTVNEPTRWHCSQCPFPIPAAWSLVGCARRIGSFPTATKNDQIAPATTPTERGTPHPDGRRSYVFPVTDVRNAALSTVKKYITLTSTPWMMYTFSASFNDTKLITAKFSAAVRSRRNNNLLSVDFPNGSKK